MSVEIKNIVNANIYLNGTSLLGQAEEIKLPTIKASMKEHKALGMVGKLKLPSGIEALEGEIKWNSFYLDTFRTCANPFKTVQLMCRSNVETWNAQGLTEEKELVTILTVQFEEVSLGTYKPQESAEYPSKFQATYVKQTLGGEPVVELDVMTNTFKVGDEDVLANYRTNTGAA